MNYKRQVFFMRVLSEKEYQRELEKVKKENIQKEYQLNLEKERNKYRKKFKFETSKLIAVYLFALLNTIVIYSMVAMWKFCDFSYLGVLISDIAAQVLIYAIYCLKAYKAKKSEEDLRFEREKYTGTLGDVLSAGANSNEYVPTTMGSVEVFEANGEDTVG